MLRQHDGPPFIVSSLMCKDRYPVVTGYNCLKALRAHSTGHVRLTVRTRIKGTSPRESSICSG